MSSQPNNKIGRSGTGTDELYGWKWFIAYGVAFIVLAGLAVAHMIVAGMISTFVVGMIMLLGAALGFGHANKVHDPDTHNCWIFSGLLYLLCGVAVLVEPFIGPRLLTLILAAGLALSGISRIVAGAQLQCTPVLLSGATTIIVATVIGIDWGDKLSWVMEYAIAADLAVQGVALLIAGEELHLRRQRALERAR